MSSDKKSKTKKLSREIFSKDFGPTIFLSALVLNYIFLSLFMFSKVRQRDAKLQLQVRTSEEGQSALDESFVDNGVLGEIDTDIKSLPMNFPADFPIYSQAELIDVRTQDGAELDAISTVWETDDLPKKAFDYYLAQLKLFGWENEIILESDNAYTLSFQKQNTEGFVGISLSELNGAVISATIGIRK